MRRAVGRAAARVLIAVWVSAIAVLGQAGYPVAIGAEPATVLQVGPAS